MGRRVRSFECRPSDMAVDPAMRSYRDFPQSSKTSFLEGSSSYIVPRSSDGAVAMSESPSHASSFIRLRFMDSFVHEEISFRMQLRILDASVRAAPDWNGGASSPSASGMLERKGLGKRRFAAQGCSCSLKKTVRWKRPQTFSAQLFQHRRRGRS